MRRSILLPALGLVVVSLLGVSLLQAQRDDQRRRGHAMGDTPPDSGMFRADELEWRDGPESLPDGAEFVLLEGDPSRAAPFTMRIKLPAGYEIPPHWHPVTERITVIEGALHLGMGETFSRGEAEALPQGAFAFMPPAMRHFAFTEGETVIQLNSIGPWDIIYINADDDPRRQRE